MFICCKAPARSLPKSPQKVLFRHDSIDSIHDRNLRTNFSTTTPLASPPRYVRKASSSAKERQRAERDQLTRLLKESPGKRDARNFLKHFDSPKSSKKNNVTGTTNPQEATSNISHKGWELTRTGVNLGNLYEPTVFTREPLPEEKYGDNLSPEPLHLALVKLRQPQALNDRTIDGIALTLSQMAQLGLSIAVVVDCDEHVNSNSLELAPEWERLIREQAARLVTALEAYNEPGAFEVEHVLGYSQSDPNISSTVQLLGGVHVKNNHLLFPPIEEGIIPVIPPVAYDSEFQKVRVQADDVLLALTREFAGISGENSRASEIDLADKPALDRVIILDPLGGIPSENRADGAHAFINLEAEYKDIKNELKEISSRAEPTSKAESFTSPGFSNPFSKFVETEFTFFPDPPSKKLSDTSAPARHSRNLDVVQRALKFLPPSSSGLILTPSQAATQAVPGGADVEAEPLKNPLIHNLLTDKPMISSSLPTNPANRPLSTTTPNPVTFLKKGIPLTMIPDPLASGGWQPPSPSNPSIDLANDPRINFPKLVALIDDSFRRKLDPKHYLERIRGRVAGVIIAGDYEGGAICTWETPSPLATSPPSSTPSHHGEPSPFSFPADIPTPTPPSDSPYWIPYLDKFAVLTSSQGSGGVSDIVWAALTRTCFPDGLIWRSRTSNPVNKWYQERARGMWNLPGGQWTMFWTTEGVVQGWDRSTWVAGVNGDGDASGLGLGLGDVGDVGAEGDVKTRMKRWDAYVSVCSGIQPSWGDGMKQLD